MVGEHGLDGCNINVQAQARSTMFEHLPEHSLRAFSPHVVWHHDWLLVAETTVCMVLMVCYANRLRRVFG